MNIQKELFAMTRAECKESGVEIYMGKGKSVRYAPNIRSNGFFDFDVPPSKKPRLAFAMGSPNWELTLVHELNHLRQWREDTEIWNDYISITGNVIDAVLSGKKVNDKKLMKDARITLLMEHDCEKRAYETLKKLGYPQKKLIEYIQKANSYALFYLYIATRKKWYKIGHEPYNMKQVWSQFPKTFDIDIDAEFEKLGHLYDLCVL